MICVDPPADTGDASDLRRLQSPAVIISLSANGSIKRRRCGVSSASTLGESEQEASVNRLVNAADPLAAATAAVVVSATDSAEL